MNHLTVEKEYCQSCGMPLRFDVEEYLGTNADNSRNAEYCYYCLKDGEFTVDIPMSEMVDVWVKYIGKYNEYSETDYNHQELRILLNKRLPVLKRWRQKEITQNIHYEAIGKIKAYIDENLEKEIPMEALCRMANLSFFHLRRVFRSVTGENIGSYIQRLRLEKVAHKLVLTGLPVSEIMKQSGYQTTSSLAKAFRKHFGISMSVCREKYVSENKSSPVDFASLRPEIKKLPAQKAICYPVGNAFRDRDEYVAVWRKLFHYCDKHLKPQKTGKSISISLDNPLITTPEQCRFYLGILTQGNERLNGKFSLQEIPAGLYAVLSHKGDYALLSDIYKMVYETWLPQNGYMPMSSMSFEVYLNSPRDTERSELLTEVYIPIEKQ